MPQANGKFEEATRKMATAKYLQMVRQVLHQCSVSYQLHCWYKKLANAGEIGHWYKDDEDPSPLPEVVQYKKQQAGGLLSVTTIILYETTNSRECIKKMPLTDELLREYQRQQKHHKEQVEASLEDRLF